MCADGYLPLLVGLHQICQQDKKHNRLEHHAYTGILGEYFKPNRAVRACMEATNYN